MQDATKKDAYSNMLPTLDGQYIVVLEPVPGSFLAQFPLIWGVVHELYKITVESRCG